MEVMEKEKESNVKEWAKEEAREKKSMRNPEEAVINKYMDGPPGKDEALTDEDRLGYRRGRYENIKAVYKGLMLQKEEAQEKKSEDILNKLTAAFRENWVDRNWAVTKLRCSGEAVIDPFILK